MCLKYDFVYKIYKHIRDIIMKLLALYEIMDTEWAQALYVKVRNHGTSHSSAIYLVLGIKPYKQYNVKIQIL